jgi:hypothetical protein
MASIRDSENWLIDYQSTTDAGGTSADELANWLREAGYTTVVEDWDRHTKDEAHLSRAGRLHTGGFHVCLVLNACIIPGQADEGPRPNHWVVLASRIEFMGIGQNRTVGMRIFTWGTLRQIPQSTRVSHFLHNYYGFVACRF